MNKIKRLGAGMAILSIFFLSGCAYTVKIKEGSDAFSMPVIQNAPKILLADFTDNRADKTKIGTINGLNLMPPAPINVILTNRIASELRNEGFNIQKASFSSKEEMINLIRSADGNALLTGRLDNFYASSIDTVLDPGKGQAAFQIKIFNKEGNAIFTKMYAATARNWIGLTGPYGCDKLIERTIQESVNELFKDNEFKNLLSKIKKGTL